MNCAAGRELRFAVNHLVCHNSSDMKTISIREFTREFASHRNEHLQVKDRGRVFGTWTPVDERPPKVDFSARLKKHFKKKLPFTGAQLLKESNDR